MRALGLIPARGGSKGVPGKNTRLLAGRPLLAYTALAAKAAKRLHRVVLTTDDEAIAAVGREWGLEVPFLRPASLAADDTPMLPVVRHAVDALERSGDRFDIICLLQPVCPMRDEKVIDGCLELLERTGCDSVFTVLPVPHEHNPHWVYFRDDQGLLRLSTQETTPIPRRQALPAAFHREGSVYAVRRDVLMNEGSLYGPRSAGYPMEKAQSVNIDTPDDWQRAEGLMRARAPS